MPFINFNEDGTVTETSFEQAWAEDMERRKHRKVKRKGKHIDIHVSKNYVYDIELSRCKTAGECLDWVHQISEKTWAWENNAQIMQDFLEVLFENIDVKLWSGGGRYGL